MLPPLDALASLVGDPEPVPLAEPAGSTPEPSTTFPFLKPADWKLLREMRLAALRDAPEAFVTTFDAEVLRPTAEWIDILDRSSWVVARRGGETVGIACLAAPDVEGPTKRFIESVWVAPGQRRRGLVRQMVQELEDRARREGAESLQLWVLDTNQSAADAYLKLGFEWVPDRVQASPERWPHAERVTERLMIRPLFR